MDGSLDYGFSQADSRKSWLRIGDGIKGCTGWTRRRLELHDTGHVPGNVGCQRRMNKDQRLLHDHGMKPREDPPAGPQAIPQVFQTLQWVDRFLRCNKLNDRS